MTPRPFVLFSMKRIVLLLCLMLSFSLNASLSGLQELADTYNPDAPTVYWLALGTSLERGLAHFTLRAITNSNNTKTSRQALLKGFLKNLQSRKRFAEFTTLIEELERHGLRMFEELTLPIPKGPQTQLPKDDDAPKSLADFDNCD